MLVDELVVVALLLTGPLLSVSLPLSLPTLHCVLLVVSLTSLPVSAV